MDREVKSSDNLVVPADWTFKNANVAQNFDQHVREQLPWYELATAIATHFGRHYMPENGLMYDLGASTGNIFLCGAEIKAIVHMQENFLMKKKKLLNAILKMQHLMRQFQPQQVI
jgi:hypothetical protein